MTLSCNLASAEVNFSYHKLSLMPSPAAGSTYISPTSPVYLSLPLSISFFRALRKIFDFHFVLTHFKEEKLSTRQDKSVLCICKEPMRARVAQIHIFVIWGWISLIIQVLTSPVVFLSSYFLSFFLISSFYLDDFF